MFNFAMLALGKKRKRNMGIIREMGVHLGHGKGSPALDFWMKFGGLQPENRRRRKLVRLLWTTFQVIQTESPFFFHYYNSK